MRISSSDSARAMRVPPPETPAAQISAIADGPGKSVRFSDLMSGIGRELDAGESTFRGAMATAGRGRDLAPTELISLQARVYRYSELVDLTSRAIDRGTSGIKAVLQGGGQ